MPCAASVSVYIIAQKKTDTAHVKLFGVCVPQWAKRFEIGP